MKRAVRAIEQQRRDELVIRMRESGASYAQIARAVGATEATSGRYAYRAAMRRREQPQDVWQADPALVADPAFVPWAAGFFDGEGCVTGFEGIQTGGYRRFSFTVVVSQTTPEPLEALQRRWGGSISNKKVPNHLRWKRAWRWEIRGEEAAIFLAEVLPYLRVKRGVAEVAIPCLFRTHKHGVRLTDEEVAVRREAIAFIRVANRRGEAAS